MAPLVSSDYPKALLTIANRPMLFYSLYSLLRADFDNVTVVVQSHFADLVAAYCNGQFHDDPAVVALEKNNMHICCLSRQSDWGTADVLRQIDFSAYDVLVLSSDYVGDIDLNSVVEAHQFSHTMCTVALVESVAPKPSAEQSNDVKTEKGKKPAKKKGSSKESTSVDFAIDHYALLNDENRLLGLFTKSDISDGVVTVRAPLISRYSTVQLRSDLFDAHIYLFNATTLSKLLKSNENISSVKFDLVPYVARRQHTISKIANQENWTHPGEEIRICAHVVDNKTYAKRANTVSEFQKANMEVASGCLNRFMGAAESDSGAKKGKKANVKKSPFATAGERVSVTADSLIGKNVSAGDRTSVKKSVVGDGSKLSSNVKINGCVVLAGVSLEEGVNLAGCVVCSGAVIGKNCTLKDCRVAKDVVIEEGTEASNRDFGQKQGLSAENDGIDDGFEFA